MVHTPEQARNALQRITGKPKDEEVYWCMSCGFAEDPEDPSRVRYPRGLTLKFDPDEIEALGGDLTNYNGPCPVCNCMTLVPMDRFSGQSIRQMAKENRTAEYKEQAKAFVDVVKDEITGGGSIFDNAPPDPTADDVPPGKTDDLPDADEVDDSDLKPRGGS